jgi:hypothetical protein
LQIDEVRAFIDTYFEVLQTQELPLFDTVFHKDCVLYSQQNDTLVVRSFASYREVVQGRNSAASGGYPRSEQVLAVDFLSPTMVTVKVRLRLFDSIVDDHLNLMKHEGRWMVYAKHYSRVGNA